MNAVRVRLLVIEDDPQIQRFLSTALESHGYDLDIVGNGADGLRQAALHQPDIVIVDMGLPDMTGLDVIARLREWFTQPILVLSARSPRKRQSRRARSRRRRLPDQTVRHRRTARASARRLERHRSERGGAKPEARIEIGNLLIDLAAHRVQRDGVDIHLTPIEYRLLAALVQHRGKVLTHRQLLREVWGAAHVESPHYLRIYLRALRQKIETDSARPQYLLTEVGVGYRFADG